MTHPICPECEEQHLDIEENEQPNGELYLYYYCHSCDYSRELKQEEK